MEQDKSSTEKVATECKIRVNEQVVTVVGGRHTPADIKRAAIEQGVSIETDFVLGIEDEPGKTRIVEDEKLLVVEADTCFAAIPKPTTAFEIVVNGRPHTVKDQKVAFKQVVELAFPDHQPNPDVVFSMTYRHAFSKPHAGELGSGGVVEVENGTIFNVTRTDKS